MLHLLHPPGSPPDLVPARTQVPAAPERRRARIVSLVGHRSVPSMDDDPVLELVIDLQAQVDRLRSIRSDIEAYYWDQPEGTEGFGGRRFQVSFWIAKVAQRIADLEHLMLARGETTVSIVGLGAGEHEAVESAGAVLDRWIHEDECFPDVQRVIGAVLAAADRIVLRAAGGVPRLPLETRGDT